MIGQRIKERRKDLQLTQQDVGRRLSVSKATVSLWEKNATAPNGANLQRLCQLLKCSPDWLLNGKERDNPGGVNEPDVRVVRVEKKDIKELLLGNTAVFPKGSDKDQLIAEATNAGPRTFIFSETSEGMTPRISPGDAVFVDPDQASPAPGKEIWLFEVGSSYLLGTVHETPRGLMLRFENTSAGWEPVNVNPADCVGRVVAFIPTWI